MFSHIPSYFSHIPKSLKSGGGSEIDFGVGYQNHKISQQFFKSLKSGGGGFAKYDFGV